MLRSLTFEKDNPPFVLVLAHHFLYFLRNLDIPHRTESEDERNDQECY